MIMYANVLLLLVRLNGKQKFQFRYLIQTTFVFCVKQFTPIISETYSRTHQKSQHVIDSVLQW